MKTRTTLRGISACALALAAASSAFAQTQINGSGATLFVDFFGLAGGTNDAIDVDLDGVYGFDTNTFAVDQLAPTFNIGAAAPATAQWIHHYRSVGSVNGYNEFVDSQLYGGPVYVVDPNTPTEAGIINRTRYADAGNILFGGAHDGSGYPTAQAARDTMAVDFAFLDVPSLWGTRIDGTAAWNAKPGQAGYGSNALVSSTGFDNKLVSITRTVNGNPVSLNFNASDNDPNTTPDANTLYDTPVAFVPVVGITNRGVGESQIEASEWQHGAVTGRKSTGENLVFTTRDTGSGTHNAWMNSLGVDPSWGVGENVGDQANSSSQGLLGSSHAVGNAGGSSIMETIVQNNRLSVGYTGLFGSSRAAADAASGKYEIFDMLFDHVGGTLYVRPSIDAVVDNLDPDTGWRIGGAGSFVTRGDPYATAHDASATSGYVNVGSGNPAMTNAQAALYLQNLLYSIGQFDGADDIDGDGIIDVVDDVLFDNDADPNNDILNDNNQVNLPGDILALNFTLLKGVDGEQSLADPTAFNATPAFNQILQDFIKDNNVTTVTAFGAINAAGLAPTRKDLTGSGNTYADGQVRNYAYYDSTNTLRILNGGQKLSHRNAVQGDFDNNGLRNLNDIDDLVSAVANPLDFEKGVNHGGSAGNQVGDYAIAHVIGDFDGNGDFDADDVRYFADGLAIDPNTGKLDRKAGFTAVDNAAGGNFFATTLQTGAAYDAGDSRGDIAHRDGDNADASNRFIVTPGAAPIGADGVIDWADIDYLYSQFVHQAGGEIDWENQSTLGLLARRYDAAHDYLRVDLSADLTGDLKINHDDIDELVQVILETEYGDFNLDGLIDGSDALILVDNFGTGSGWAQGDTDGNGVVDGADALIFVDHFGFGVGGLAMLSTGDLEALSQVTALVPEPATAMLLLTLGAGLTVRHRRRD